jgi:hypothetical protein
LVKKKKMKVFILCAFLAISIEVSTAGESPLDQPSQRKITVGSEIERGRREVDAASSHMQLNILRYSTALDAPLDRNRSQNTDSDGFLLGAYLSRWMNLEIVLPLAKPEYNRLGEIPLVQRDAAETFGKMRALQKKLGLDDEMLCSAAGFKDTTKIKEMINKYEAGGEALGKSAQSSTAQTTAETKTATLILTQPVLIQLPSGNLTLAAGTQLQFVTRNGENVRIRYMNADYEIPISTTDLK